MNPKVGNSWSIVSLKRPFSLMRLYRVLNDPQRVKRGDLIGKQRFPDSAPTACVNSGLFISSCRIFCWRTHGGRASDSFRPSSATCCEKKYSAWRWVKYSHDSAPSGLQTSWRSVWTNTSYKKNARDQPGMDKMRNMLLCQPLNSMWILCTRVILFKSYLE